MNDDQQSLLDLLVDPRSRGPAIAPGIVAVKFFVPGRPRPKGSLHWICRGGKAVPIHDEARKAAEAYEARIRLHAGIAVEELAKEGVAWVMAEPVHLDLVFCYHRPAVHYRGGSVRHDAPAWPFNRASADVDKLERTVLDGLTGVLYNDDCQVVELNKLKRFDRREGVMVGAYNLPPI